MLSFPLFSESIYMDANKCIKTIFFSSCLQYVSSLPLSLLSSSQQNGPKFPLKGFHNPAVAHSPVLANRNGHVQYNRNTWRRRKRESLPASVSR